MESRKIVLRQTGVVAAGVTLCTAAMLGIYAMLNRFDLSVLYGGLVGAILAIGNFFFMAVIATLAADRAENQDVSGGQKLITGSYPVRLLVLGIVLFACGRSGWFDILALVLPLLFVQPVITVAEFFRKKGV